MKTSKFAALILLAVMSYPGGGCGVVVGNPDDPDEEEQAFVPTIDFTLPASVTGDTSALRLTSAGSILGKWASRTDKIVAEINSVLERLNRDSVKGSGTFTGKGPDGLLSGSITAIDAGDYKYQGVLCYEGAPFQLIRWSSDGTSVYTIRDFRAAPVKKDVKGEMVSEVTYRKADTTSLIVATQGVPFSLHDGVADGPNLVEHMTITKSSSSAFVLKGVDNWYPEGEEPLAAADGYLVGAFDGDGAGEFLGYEKDKSELCPDPFQEGGAANPGWCLGASIGGTRYSPDERVAAWERLKANGYAVRANLKKVELPPLTCP